MKILIVDGNEKSASDRYTEIGIQTQYEVYKAVLENLSDINLEIITIHPAHVNSFLPIGLKLDDFQGIVWTGSVLNIYEKKDSINRQIELAKSLLTKKNKIFGSCWGLQILATAAGGKVRKNPKGLEAIISNNIKLNKEGILHPMYKNKPPVFNAFCWHYDEIEILPDQTKILSSNSKSSVQSFSFSRNNSEVWAVQYHPEFNPKWMSGLMLQRKQLLLDEEIFSSEEDYEKLYNYLSDIKKFNFLKDELSISDTLIESKIHTIELFNWLNYLKNNI
tara:strand:- start:374 stop:1204 length:831 start_codon:yes stop_codon:yes gene_type:complete